MLRVAIPVNPSRPKPNSESTMDTKTLRDWLARILDLLGISSEGEDEAEVGKGASFEAGPPADEAQSAAAPEPAAPESSGPEIVPLDDQGRRMLGDIRKYASWSGPEGQRNLEQVREAFALAYPGHEGEIDHAIQQGRALLEICNRAYRAANSRGAKSKEVQAIREEARRDHSWNINRVESQIERGHTAFERRRSSRSSKHTPRTPVKPRTAGPVRPTTGGGVGLVRPSSVAIPPGLHGSDVRAQQPCAEWTVVIDESGSEFGADLSQVKASRKGRFVAVVVPRDRPALPDLPKAWHAVDCSDDNEINQVFQNILSAEVGVFGVTVESLPTTPGERWMDGVALLIDWILRLLPVDGPTRLKVLVENRGEFRQGERWPLVERDCLRRLALAFPQTAGWIDLRIQVVGKDGSEIGGYADALAFTWARTSDASKARMRESKLAGTCLVEGDARQLLHAWDAFAQGVRLPGPDWWRLLPEAAAPAFLVGTLLERIGLECHADASRWSVYLDETRRQMAGGAVELARLAEATAWLERFKPAEAGIPPLMRLAWLIVKLARSNHYGDAESAWERELESLAPGLLDEAAPLVCHTDLHLAVARTNRFDFEGAGRALARWRDLPVAVPGLRYCGQVRSSLGQHAAFQGRQSEAVEFFEEALEGFARLSDPAVRDKECAQTACYWAIATMDDPAASDSEVRAAVERVTGPLDKAAARLATSGSPFFRYAHHLLLRWLVHRGDPAIVSSYLSHRGEWKTGEGHPWPLIQLYRAILLHSDDPAAARGLALDAAEAAFAAEQGPVVRLIGACCRTIAANWGDPWAEAGAELDELAATLPQAAERIGALQKALAQPTPALELLVKVLPFNFR